MEELNDRVKNNLALVASLISLKDRALGNAADLSDVMNQVNAVVAVHQQLQTTDNVTHIPFRAYIDELLTGVFSQWRGESVAVEAEIEDVEIPTRTAMQLGLILNELATNAMKYGFRPGEKPRFKVGFHVDAGNGQWVLEVSNSGAPFPEDVSLKDPQTLGLQLITASVKQLDGTMEVDRSPRPVFTIRISVKE
jgi:two-component sensor histidine kinase